jgi:F-type H+-transporting ATPase subunit a
LTREVAFAYVGPLSYTYFSPAHLRTMTRGKKLTLLPISFLGASIPALAAAETGAHEGIATAAETLFHIGPLPVTNSMVTSWVIALALIALIRLAIRRPKLVPTRAQAMVESVVQGILDLISPITGKHVAKHAFPLLIALFCFILIQNWSGLLPGVGSIYISDASAHGGWKELIRPGNADMNSTIALAIVSMAAWAWFVLRYAGLRYFVSHTFGNKADRREIPLPFYLFLTVVFVGVGVVELISMVFRPVSLSFRLFGNVFGGENLMHSMFGIFKWGLPIPFYFLEILIGVVQALVFTLLVAVYIGLVCNHGEDEHAPGAASH